MDRENLLRLMKDLIENLLAGNVNGIFDANEFLQQGQHYLRSEDHPREPPRHSYNLRPRPRRSYNSANPIRDEPGNDDESAAAKQLSDFATFMSNVLAIFPDEGEYSRNRFERFVDHVGAFFDEEPLDEDDYQEPDDPNDPDYVPNSDNESDDSDAGPGEMHVEEIEQLPIRKFGSPSESQFPRSNDLNDVRCHVCLVDFKVGDDLRRLPCFHEYHKLCIDYWLQMKRVCPICQLIVVVAEE